MQIFSDKKKKRVIENRVMENRVKRGITVLQNENIYKFLNFLSSLFK